MIREISDLYGGDDEDFLNAYIEELLKEWSNRMGELMCCLEDLHKQALVIGRKRKNRDVGAVDISPVRGHGAFKGSYDKVAKKSK